ncbi:MAG: hypothetical protein ACPGJV_02415 [Bacteriovoracaceae bacterium]
MQIKLLAFDKTKQLPQNIIVELKKKDQEVVLNYKLDKNPELKITENHSTQLKRRIGLWESTCFEFFLRDPETGHYLEFNFSTTGLWNCFYFKEKGQDLEEYFKLNLKTHRRITSSKSLEFTFSFSTNDFPEKINLQQWLVNPTVILESSKEKAFYASIHPKEGPDFHNEANFLNYK